LAARKWANDEFVQSAELWLVMFDLDGEERQAGCYAYDFVATLPQVEISRGIEPLDSTAGMAIIIAAISGFSSK
jgi:hypothetical protein